MSKPIKEIIYCCAGCGKPVDDPNTATCHRHRCRDYYDYTNMEYTPEQRQNADFRIRLARGMRVTWKLNYWINDFAGIVEAAMRMMRDGYIPTSLREETAIWKAISEGVLFWVQRDDGIGKWVEFDELTEDAKVINTLKSRSKNNIIMEMDNGSCYP